MSSLAADCIEIPGSTYEPSGDATLTVDNLVFASSSVEQLQADGVTTITIPALAATWDVSTNPYVIGVGMEWVPTGGGPKTPGSSSITAPDGWKSSDGIVSNVEYSCTYWAKGINGLIGDVSDPQIVTITAILSVGDNDADLRDKLNTLPKNQWRFDTHAASGAAVTVGVPPDAPFTAFGDQQMAFQIPGGAPGVKVVADGRTQGLKSRDGAGYAYQFMAKTTDAGGSTLKVGWRDQSNNPLSDLADQTYAITTTPTTFYWNNIESDDPDFVTAKLVIFDSSGGIDSGETVTLTNLMINGDSGIKTAYTPWRPSPDESYLTRYRTLIDTLYGTDGTAGAGMRPVRSADGLTDVYVPAGPVSTAVTSATAITLKATDDGSLIQTSSSSAVAITVPLNATVPIPIHFSTTVRIGGTGDVTVAGSGGVTVNPPASGSLVVTDQGADIVLTKIATDTWNMSVIGVAGASSAIAIKDEGSTLTAAVTSIDFTGAGVAATNTGGAVTVNVPSGGVSDFFAAGVPALSAFTQVNSSGTWTETTGKAIGLATTGAGASTGKLVLLAKAAPSAPFRLAGMVSGVLAFNNSVNGTPGVGVAFRNSTSGKIVTFGLLWASAAWGYQVENWTDPNTFSAQVARNTTQAPNPLSPVLLGIYDDGTNIHFQQSTDGANWVDIGATLAKASWFLSAGYDQIAFWVSRSNWATTPVAASLTLWDEAGLSRAPLPR